MNDSNLKPFETLTESAQREIRSKGGRVSAAKKRQAKAFREIGAAILQGRSDDPETIRRMKEVGMAPDLKSEIMYKQIVKANGGDTSAAVFVRDTIGEKPVDKTLKLNAADENTASMLKALKPLRGVSCKYRSFFESATEQRHVFLQGGRRSGKTFSTFKWLMAYVPTFAEGDYIPKVMVCCSQFPQLQRTMEDFTNATGADIRGSQQKGFVSRTWMVDWQFCNFDDKTKAQGTACDFLFINEAVNVPRDIAEVLMQSCRKQCYYNYNPTKKFWGTEFQNETNLLCTTFADNSYLTDEQRGEFEALKERAQRPNATRHDEYMYQVYYLGNFGNMAGSVFGGVGKCTVAEYRNIPAYEAIGIDFGFAVDGDPTTCIGVKLYDKRIYVHQYIYERGLTSDEELAERLLACGFNYKTEIFGDYGGMGRSRMDNLIAGGYGKWSGEASKGFNICNAVKGSILDGISAMLSQDGIFVTDTSAATIDEMECYELDDNGRTHGADHAIDACRYAFMYLKNIQ